MKMSLIWKLPFCFILLACSFGLVAQALPTNNQCGKPSRDPKIVGGVLAVQDEFPWMVSVKSKYGHFCAGFIIGQRTVLSAAHCFLERSNPYIEYDNGKVVPSSIYVVLGEFDQRKQELPVDAVNVKVEEVIVHAEYDTRSKENDIAILRLAQDISVHPNVQPICIPQQELSNKYFGKKGIVAGWGRHYFDQPTSDWEVTANVMKKGVVTVWDSSKCSQTYNDRGFNFPSKSFLCAGDPGTDSCQGDSGGSLQVLQGDRWVAMGIVSVGKACGANGLPGVYTDVFSFNDWIHSNAI